MKKLINGATVDIGQDVMELFERAAEGTMTRKKIMNRIDIVLENTVGHLGDIIEAYYRSYAALPYPLYQVEDEIKYATIAANMQRLIKVKLGYLIELEIKDRIIRAHSEEDLYIDLASEYWAIEDAEGAAIEPVEVTLDNYKDDVLYRFFNWCDEQLKSKHNTSGFYAYAIPSLLTACNNKPIIVKWEMAKILQFAALPEVVDVADRRIYNNDTGTCYTMDCYWGGKYSEEVSENILVIDCRPEAKNIPSKMISKRKKIYVYDVYEDDKEMGRISLQSSKSRFKNVFDIIVRECDDVVNAKYFGIIDGDYIALQVGEKIYTGKLGEPLSETGVGVKLLNVQSGRAYISKDIKKSSGATRETIYIYDIEKDILKVCDIHYKKEVKLVD